MSELVAHKCLAEGMLHIASEWFWGTCKLSKQQHFMLLTTVFPWFDPNILEKSSSILLWSLAINRPSSSLSWTAVMALGTLFSIVFKVHSTDMSSWAKFAPLDIKYLQLFTACAEKDIHSSLVNNYL